MIHVDEGAARGRLLRTVLAGAASAAVAISGLAVVATPAYAAQPGAAIAVDPQGGEFYGGPLAVGSTVNVSLTNYPLAADPGTPNVKVEYCGFSIQNFRPNVIACSEDSESTKTVAVVDNNGKGETFQIGDVVVPIRAAAGFTTGGVTVNCQIQTCGIRTSSVGAVEGDPAAKTGGYITLGANPTMSVTLADGSAIPASGIKYTDGFTKIKVTGKNFRPGTKMRLLQCDLVAHSGKCFGVTSDGNGYVDTPVADLSGSWSVEMGVTNKLDGKFNCFVTGTDCGLLTSRFDAGGDRGQEASVKLKFAPPATALSVDPQGGQFYGGPVAVGSDVTVTLTNYPVSADGVTPNVKVEYCGFSIANFRPTVTACATSAASVKTVAVTSDINASFGTKDVKIKAVAGFTTGGVTVDCLAGTCGFRTSSVTPPAGSDPAAKTGAYITLGANPTMTATLANGDPLPAAGIPANGFTKIKVTGKNFRPGTQVRLLECNLTEHAAKCSGVTSDGNGYVETPAADYTGTWTTEIGVTGSIDGKFNCYTQGTDCGLLTSRYDAGGDRGQEAALPLKFAAPDRARIDVDPQGGEFYGGPLAADSEIEVKVSNLPLAKDPNVDNVKVEYCGFAIANFRPTVIGCDTAASNIKNVAVTTANATGLSGDVTVTLKAAGTIGTGTDAIDCLVATCGFRATATGGTGTVTATGGYVTLGDVPTMTVTMADGSAIPAAGIPYSTGFTTIKVTGNNFRPGTKMRLLECDLTEHAAKCYGVSDDGNGYVDTPEADADGTWTTEIGVANSNVKEDDTVVFDCFAAGTSCGLLTSRYDAGGDRGQETSVALKFAPKPTPPVAPKAPTKAKVKTVKVKKNGNVVIKWQKAQAQGTPVTGYVVQVKPGKKAWTKAGATKASAKKLVWKKGKAGKYKVRVIATSKAGNSTSAVAKFKIKK